MHAARTEVGHVRRRNEDSMLVVETAGVYAVADGLGGHPCGDLASQTAVTALQRRVADGPPEGEDVADWLMSALYEAHDAVVSVAEEDADRTGMATTIVLAHVAQGSFTVAHVGDSRAYLLAGHELHALTQDHGLGGYITQALGLDRAIRPDVVMRELAAGDRLLLCTDGLTNMVSEQEIGALLGTGDVTAAVDALVEAALANGGIDNVTVLVVEG